MCSVCWGESICISDCDWFTRADYVKHRAAETTNTMTSFIFVMWLLIGARDILCGRVDTVA